jgi:hypothetical protein
MSENQRLINLDSITKTTRGGLPMAKKAKKTTKRKTAKITSKKTAPNKSAKKKAALRKSNENMTLIEHSTGREYVLPVMEGSIGPKVIDVRRLYGDMGYFTYDPGYTSTGSCESAITYIDGEEGILQYRGYPIQDLAAKSDYMESCYLLLYGQLPNKEEKANQQFLSGLPPRCPPDGHGLWRRGFLIGLLSRQHRYHEPP